MCVCVSGRERERERFMVIYGKNKKGDGDHRRGERKLSAEKWGDKSGARLSAKEQNLLIHFKF